MSNFIDRRGNYRIKVAVTVEFCEYNSYTFNTISQSERCKSSKVTPSEAATEVRRVIKSVRDDTAEMMGAHIDELIEQAAKKKAMEEAGESC